MWNRFRRAVGKKNRPTTSRLRVEALEDRVVPAAFTEGNLVIYRVGDNSAALNSTATAVFLDEYTPSGTLVQSIEVPVADSGSNQTLTASGTATSEGALSRSADGQYLVFTGYDAPEGTASVAGTSSGTVARTIGRVAADGSIDTSTTTTSFSGTNIRSATSLDGTNFWAAGGNTGVVFTSLGGSGAGTVVSSTTTNLRVVQIFDDQLYVSSGSGSLRLGTVGTGTPTSSGQSITNLPGFPTSGGSPYGYFFADLDAGVAGVDTLYVADDSAGLTKYSLVGGNWTAKGTVGTNANDYRSVTGVESGDTVTLYATLDNGSAASTIVSISDNSGYNGTFSATATVVATGGAFTAFRGITFAPTAPAGNEPPTLTATALDPTFTEDGSAATLFSEAAVSTVESGQNIDTLVLTVSGIEDLSEEFLIIDGTSVDVTSNSTVTTADNGLTAAVALNGAGDTATVTITKSGGFAPAVAVSLANALAYNNVSDNTTAGDRVVTFTSIKDTGGTANGGSDTAPLSVASTVAVVAVNDAPVLENAFNFEAIDEDDTANTGALVATLVAEQIADPDGPGRGIAVTATDTANGVWQYSTDGGDNWTSVGTVSETSALLLLADTDTRLRFVPNADFNGTASITFRAWDASDGGTAGTKVNTSGNGGTTAFSTATKSSSVTVNAVNDAPSGTDTTVSTTQDTAYTFTAADFGFGDADGDSLLAVKITTLPGAGALTLSGNAVSANDFVSAADIGDGKLVFTPAAGGTGSPYASFTFQVRDGGGTGNGGVDLDPSANTLTIDVGAVNRAPSGADNTVTTTEDAAYTFATADFGFTDADGDGLLAVQVTTLPGAGFLTLNGSTFAAGQSVSASDIAAGNLKFVPVGDANGTGYASFTFQVQDDGSTANGGVDLDPSANTITVDVTAVNDAPTLATISDASGQVGVEQTVSLSGITAGGGESQGLAVTATSGDTAVVPNPTVSYTSPDGTGSLTFTPLASGTTTITVTVADDGGTPNDSSDDLSFQRTVAVNVAANVPPQNTAPAGVTTDEDAAFAFTGASAVSVSDPDNTPGDLTTTVSIPAGAGTLNGGVTSLTFTGSAASINSSLASLTFTPAADFNGPVTLTVSTTDAQGANDTDTVGITVNAVNDAPSFALNGDPAAVNEDAGAQTVTGFATNASAGPADESGQAIAFVVTANTNAALFSAGPAIDASGNLTYTPAPGASGTATVTVVLTDNGGTANGGADTSAAQQFTITVDAVSDAPTGSDVTLATDEDAPLTLTAADFGFGDAGDSPADAFAGVVITTLPAAGSLTLSGAAVTAGQLVSAADLAAGNLVFTPAADANGTGYASFTFQVQDDGSTANGGENLDATPNAVTVDVAAVNDQPTVTVPENLLVQQDSGPYTQTGFATFSPGGGADEASQTPTYTVTVGNPALFSVQPQIDAAGTLTFTPAPGASGPTSLTVTVDDGGSTAAVSDPATVALTVAATPTPPVSPVSVAAGAQLIAIGSDLGTPGRVRVLNAQTGAVVRDFAPFGAFAGGLRVAVADMTGDGVDDVVVAAASQIGLVAVFDGVTGGLSRVFLPFGVFPSGVQIGTGDLNGDGRQDLVVGLDNGAPLAVAIDGVTGGVMRVFAGVGGATGGIRMAVGDFTGDGRADVATVAGPGGNGLVLVYDGTTGGLASAFFAAPGYTGEINLAMGDVTGDGLSELVAGISVGGTTVVGAFNSSGGVAKVFAVPTGPGSPARVGPSSLVVNQAARIAVGDVNGDNVADVILADPPGSLVSRIVVISGATGAVIQQGDAMDPLFGTGAFVAAG